MKTQQLKDGGVLSASEKMPATAPYNVGRRTGATCGTPTKAAGSRGDRACRGDAIVWDDPCIGVEWPVRDGIVLSDKNRVGKVLRSD